MTDRAAKVKEIERLRKIEGREVSRAARAPAAEAREAGPFHEQTAGQLPAGLEPRPPRRQRPEEAQRPDELMVELPGIGRTTDEAQHRSAGDNRDKSPETATHQATGEEVEYQQGEKDLPAVDADRGADRAASQDEECDQQRQAEDGAHRRGEEIDGGGEQTEDGHGQDECGDRPTEVGLAQGGQAEATK